MFFKTFFYLYNSLFLQNLHPLCLSKVCNKVKYVRVCKKVRDCRKVIECKKVIESRKVIEKVRR